METGATFLDLSKITGAVKKTEIPHIKPMLATLIDRPFNRDSWFFEIKWDGYRAIAELKSKRVNLYSRNDISFNELFKPIMDSLQKILPGLDSAIFDGEVVVVDSKGRSNFQLLQKYNRSGKGNLVYYIFDLLYFNGFDLTGVELWKRKEILNKIISSGPASGSGSINNIRVSDHIVKNGIEMFRAALDNNLEGIIAKDSHSFYNPGTRSKSWLKVKASHEQEVVIGGYTEPKGSRKNFGALVTGVYKDNELLFTGLVGGGFSEEDLEEIKIKLERITTASSPFRQFPNMNEQIKWVKPLLIAQVKFTEWTDDNIMRQPVFMGLREDKQPAEVNIEKPEAAIKTENSNISEKNTAGISVKNVDRNKYGGNKYELHESKVKLSNLDKIYWPEEGLIKKDLIDYYKNISSFILPYIKDRPQSLNRHPNGVKGESFFQKDIDPPYSVWVETIDYYSDSTDKIINYLVCKDLDSLLYMANLGCIEINPWASRIENLYNPDFLILDLDPEGAGFDKVMEVALMIRKILEKIEVEGYPKTSGGRGIHVYLPLGAKYTFDQSLQFSKILSGLINERMPDITSTERAPHKRKGKVYLDCYQNRIGQTVAAPYSLRPRSGAPVSTPLVWDELNPKLSPLNFTIKTIFNRLERTGDLWQKVLGPGIDMIKCIDRISRFFHY